MINAIWTVLFVVTFIPFSAAAVYVWARCAAYGALEGREMFERKYYGKEEKKSSSLR